MSGAGATVQTPIYDAGGGVIGWIDGLANDAAAGAIEVFDDTGAAIGNFENASLAQVQSMAAGAGAVATQAYDAAGNAIGFVVKGAQAGVARLAGDAEALLETVLKWTAIVVVGAAVVSSLLDGD